MYTGLSKTRHRASSVQGQPEQSLRAGHQRQGQSQHWPAHCLSAGMAPQCWGWRHRTGKWQQQLLLASTKQKQGNNLESRLT